MIKILTDEAASKDRLHRARFVDALGTVVTNCDTPFVLGVFGDWGTGKTTLLSMLRLKLVASGERCVWFDAWLHQDDESPAIALVQTMSQQLDMGEEGRKLLMVIGSALGGALLKTSTTIGLEDISKLGERYEKERFLEREARIRLREHFAGLVNKARGTPRQRIVFFIDDLDRCSPDSALALLEALRLYLNLKGCVFVLAADRLALHRAIAKRYGADDVQNARYLDKIVQLPFTVPHLSDAATTKFVQSLLPRELRRCLKFLVSGLGGNPRSAKRFINILSLNHELARKAKIDQYDPAILCLILLLQYHDPERYQLFAADPTLLFQLIEDSKDEKNPTIRDVVQHAKGLPKVDLQPYFFLAEVSSVDLAEVNEERPNEAFMRPMQVSDELSAVIGGKSLPRTEITKRIWSYIKRNKLQDTKNRRMINVDDRLQRIFGQKKQVSMFEMTKLVSKHLK